MRISDWSSDVCSSDLDLRFTDPKGKWQHLTMVSSALGEDELEDGLMFDGSSIEGWKAINESDMILKPDLDAVYTDPFSATPMLIVFCDIVEPDPTKLTNFGISYSELGEALEKANLAVGANFYNRGGEAYLVRVDARARSVDEIRNAVAATRGGVAITVGQKIG